MWCSSTTCHPSTCLCRDASASPLTGGTPPRHGIQGLLARSDMMESIVAPRGHRIPFRVTQSESSCRFWPAGFSRGSDFGSRLHFFESQCGRRQRLFLLTAKAASSTTQTGLGLKNALPRRNPAQAVSQSMGRRLRAESLRASEPSERPQLRANEFLPDQPESDFRGDNPSGVDRQFKIIAWDSHGDGKRSVRNLDEQRLLPCQRII